MTETFEQYRERVLGYLGARDPGRVLVATPRRLARLVAEAAHDLNHLLQVRALLRG